MTTWTENPRGGRERGPRGLARAWVELLVRPRRFFRNGVAPGDQAPGLVFAVAVALVYVASRFLFLPSARPAFFPGQPVVSALVGLGVVGLIVAPAALHLTAAIQTLLLIPGVRERAGVSETVQVLAYATAPCALAGVAAPPGAGETLVTLVAGWRLLCALWGVGLLVVGMATVHRTSVLRAAVVTLFPATLVFGYLFGGLFAAETVFGVELVDTTPPGR